MTTPDNTAPGLALPGFRSLFELGVSDVLQTFVQGVGRVDGNGYALRTDGTVWKWESRTLLVGSTYEPVRYPTHQLASLKPVSQLAGNWPYDSSPRFALQTDGTVWGWGEDLYDEVGLETTDYDVPVQQTELKDVRHLLATSAGETRLALLSTGEVWGWGSNYFGHLGDGTTENSLKPKPIPALRDITALEITTAGRCLALQSTGQVWTWAKPFGGDASEDALTPTQVAGLPAISALFEDAATAVDGSFWMWDDDLTPSQVPGLSNVVAFVSDAAPFEEPTHHAVRHDGTVWGWGSNKHGEIGDGTIVDRADPTALAGLSNIDDIVGRGAVRFARSRSGDVYGWSGAVHADSSDTTPRRLPLPRAEAAPTFQKWGSIQPVPIGLPIVGGTDHAATLIDLSSGKTHLMHWCAVGDVLQVRALIEQGADVNAVDDDGDSALYYAACNGRTEVAELLLNRGADPNITGATGHALTFAVDKGWTTLVSTLTRIRE